MPSNDSSGSRPSSEEQFAIPSVGLEAYLDWQRETCRDKGAYWEEQAGLLDWAHPFEQVLSLGTDPARARWFSGGSLSVVHNCLLRWTQDADSQRVALRTYEDGRWHSWSFGELSRDVQAVSNVLAGFVGQGDSVAVVMDGTRTSVVMLLACAWLGAVAVPLSQRLSGRALQRRLDHADVRLVLLGREQETHGVSGASSSNDQGRIVVTGGPLGEGGSFSRWVSALAEQLEAKGTPRGDGQDAQAAVYGAQQPLLWVYANAASEMPRPAVFPAAGLLVQAAAYHSVLFCLDQDVRQGRSLILGLDPSTVAAQVHGLWGPLCQGWTVTLTPWKRGEAHVLCSFPGELEQSALLTYPDYLDALLDVVEDEASPMALGQVMSTGASLRPVTVRRCARTLVSEPTRVTNLWSQTEVGGGLLATMPSSELNRPGALGLPLPGIEPRVFDDFGQTCKPNESGLLTFVPPWPALARAVGGQEERFSNLFFSLVEGMFSTRDGVRRDEDGFYWFMRRLDDRILIDGVAVSTSEVEVVLAHHEGVAEAAVVPLKTADGDRLAAFVVPIHQQREEESFKVGLREQVRDAMGPAAVPSVLVLASALPRTKSGKVVRRLLRRLLSGEFSEGEDLAHLANPEVVSDLARRMGGGR